MSDTNIDSTVAEAIAGVPVEANGSTQEAAHWDTEEGKAFIASSDERQKQVEADADRVQESIDAQDVPEVNTYFTEAEEPTTTEPPVTTEPTDNTTTVPSDESDAPDANATASATESNSGE
jgi:hypothetical protein